MSDNPYQPPQVELSNSTHPEEIAGFYVVSKKKMVLLFILTLGIYQLYWFYRNWQSYRQLSGQKIWPLPRAIFAVFFVHSLFRGVNDQRDRLAERLPAWNHSLHATIIVLLLIISQVLDRLSSKAIGSPFTDYAALLLLGPLVVCFASAQQKINEACGDPQGETNSKFTAGNYIWMILGVLMWVLIGAGFFMTPEPI